MSEYDIVVGLTAGGLAVFLIGGAAFSAHMVRVYDRRIARTQAARQAAGHAAE